MAALEAEGAVVQGLDLAGGFDVSDPQAWLDVEPADLVCLNAGVLAKGDGTVDDYRRIVGVNVDGVVRTLLTRGLVTEAGQDTGTAGTLYRTTPLLLEKLGLQSLEELPDLAPLLPDLDELDDTDTRNS